VPRVIAEIRFRSPHRAATLRHVFDLPPAAWPGLDAWFRPERPGPLVHQQAVRTGIGRCRVDRWPDPQIVLAEIAGNHALRGDPDRLRPGDLDDVAGFVEAPPEWLPALVAADPGLARWPRLIATLPPGPETVTGVADPCSADPGAADVVGSYEIRRIGPADVKAVAAYDPDGDWIAATWGGPALLAHALVAHGAFTGDRLVSVAVPFYVGTEHADIGVVTEQAHRGRGLSTACAAAVVIDIRARGLLPTWTTSPDNAASLAVAARLGFLRHREDVLYAMRVPIPT
jgi:RimJ/RimL family protein N-acetyltransferase